MKPNEERCDMIDGPGADNDPCYWILFHFKLIKKFIGEASTNDSNPSKWWPGWEQELVCCIEEEKNVVLK